MVTTHQIKATIAQATAFFEAREELAFFEQSISKIIKDGLNRVDWPYLAEEIIDAVRCIIPDARDGDGLSIEGLRGRLEVMESLPEEWWHQSHPISPNLAEFVDERSDLRWFFDEFEDVIAENDHTTLLPDWKVRDDVLQVVCERSGADVENLDPALMASINKDVLIEQFKKNGGTLQGVELYGSTWLLGH